MINGHGGHCHGGSDRGHGDLCSASCAVLIVVIAWFSGPGSRSDSEVVVVPMLVMLDVVVVVIVMMVGIVIVVIVVMVQIVVLVAILGLEVMVQVVLPLV